MREDAATFEQVLEAALRRVLDERLAPLEAAVRRLKPEEEVLSVKGAAALLGWSERTVRIKAKDAEIPAFKLPGSKEWRFNRAALLEAVGAAALDVDEESRKIVASLPRRR